jgi:nicotinamide riboside kinase
MTALSLVGAHRTGKTTLAKAYALKSGARFLETSVSAINKEFGFDLSKEHSFAERLDHQERILTRIDAIYAECAGEDFVTDRSPIDMLAYTMAEAYGDRVAPEDQERFAHYVQRCIEVTNRRFGVLVLVQPGIPIVAEEGKAVANAAYMEQLNSICLGLTADERVKPIHFYIPRKTLSVNERVEAIEFAVGRAQARTMQIIQAERTEGLLLH